MPDVTTVVYRDGTREGVPAPSFAALVDLEEKFGISASQLAEPNPRLQWTAYLLWHELAAGKNGEAEPFESWLARVATIEEPEGEAPDPTNPEQPPE